LKNVEKILRESGYSMQDEDLKKLMDTVRRLSDIEEIRSLRDRYHHFVNEGQFDRFRELYTADASMHFPGPYCWTGIEEILRGLEALSTSIPFMKQFGHNHHIVLDGDAAKSVAYLEAKYARQGESVMVAGRYDDEFTRTEDGWRIKRTTVTLFFSVPFQQGWADTDVQAFDMRETVVDGAAAAERRG
jgi:ketosteroid isomerase-like protein